MNRIIAALLTLLGFGAAMAGCAIMYGPPDDEGDGDGMYMYGSPYASFRISGTVVDEAGDPVRDIKIAVKLDPTGEDGHESGAGITDAHGNYVVTGDTPGDTPGGPTLIVSAEDVDGDKNGGEFVPETMELKVEAGDYVGGEGWNRGTVIKTADFELELKPQNDENE